MVSTNSLGICGVVEVIIELKLIELQLQMRFNFTYICGLRGRGRHNIRVGPTVC